MHLLIPIGGLIVATGSLIYVIVMGRKTKRLYAEAEANWRKAEESWKQVGASWKRIGELQQQTTDDLNRAIRDRG